jgi:enoyl-CoA hydratase/carnithine racemase
MTAADSRPVVLTEHVGPVAIVTMNRPGSRNALNSQLLAELKSAMEDLAAEHAVNCIVLTGAGSAFCAGADLKESAVAMADGSDFWSQRRRASQSMQIHQRLPRLPVPVIAAVNGHAVAGGCGLAVSCDVVIASERARFGYPEVGRGLVAAMAMVSLSRVVGRHQALDLLLSGRIIDAAEALRIGMVNQVVHHDDLMKDTLRYATDMASNSKSAMHITKELYQHVLEMDYERALEYTRDVNLMVRQTGDAKEGTNAYVADRARRDAT